MVRLAASMGLAPLTGDAGVDRDLLIRVLDQLHQEDIATAVIVDEAHELDPGATREIIRRVLDALEASAIPDKELPALAKVLGADLLSDLLGVSEASLRRYSAGTRSVPDEVASRAHFLSSIVADLRGGYNRFGVRRWFGRRRKLLDGASPSELLSGGWDPDEAAPQRVADLAHWLAIPSAS